MMWAVGIIFVLASIVGLVCAAEMASSAFLGTWEYRQRAAAKVFDVA